MLSELFRDLDDDCSGELDVEEIRELSRRLGEWRVVASVSEKEGAAPIVRACVLALWTGRVGLGMALAIRRAGGGRRVASGTRRSTPH
eukprot:COSAG01_NODE_2955_length_6799_cov_5.722090_5_plen_88_part_00